MATFRFLTRADCHLSDKPPVARIDDYKSAILDKVNQIYVLATEKTCDVILDAGDFFHVKAPTKNSHSLINEISRQHYLYDIPVYSVIGNHDVMYGNTETIDKQPLGTLFNTNTFQYLQDKTFLKDGKKVRVVGIDYQLDVDVSLQNRCVKGDEDVLIAVFHGNVSDLPLFPGEKFYSYKKLSELDPDIWVLGHIHKDQGIQKVNGKYFISVGAVSRGALTHDDIVRTPRVSYIEINIGDLVGISVEPIDLKVMPSKKVFDFDLKKKKQEENRKIESFVQNLITTTSQDPEDRLKEVISDLDLESEIKETIYHYLEMAENA